MATFKSFLKAFILFVFLMTHFFCDSYDSTNEANKIIELSGMKGGLIVHLGCKDGKLTVALGQQGRFLVHGLDSEAENIDKARQHIMSKGLYGPVSVDHLRSDQLPYIDNLVNMIVVQDAEVPEREMMRVLVPGGILLKNNDSGWQKTSKPRSKNLDEWTHYLYDASGNPVSHDKTIGPPRQFQWVGSPRWSRHHDRMASMSALVSSNGRLFYIMDEGPRASILLPSDWYLIARDAFNGSILWKKPIEKWQTHMWPYKSGPANLPRRLVSIRDQVFVTLGIEAPVTLLDAATGDSIQTFGGTTGTEEFVVSNDILLALVRPDSTRWKSFKPTRLDHPEVLKKRPWDEKPEHLMAIHTKTGDILWKHVSKVLPLTLAADSNQVYFHNGEKLVCLDIKTGDQHWTSSSIPRWSDIVSFFGPTLVVHDGVVLFAGGENMKFHSHGWDTMTALSAETGEVLWTAEHPPSGYQSPEDILVANNVVWTAPTALHQHSGNFTGRDLHTGELIKRFPPDVETYWFHHRCYRAKATDKYLLMSRTGIECVDPMTEHWDINHWVRGGCLYGIMPANGLIYAPPHDCACYPEAKLYGFCALAPQSNRGKTRHIENKKRLEKGPAYGQDLNIKNTKTENWSTYRHDALRSGYTPASLLPELKKQWNTVLGGKISSPVLVNGNVFVTQIDKHQVLAIDDSNGKIRWQYAAGGRVDSPPTVYQGRVVFGSADGRIYCLRASDGQLIWRFQAAPADLRMMAFEQIESVWPVHGSVLVQNDVVFAVAGRSMFLDGGLRFYRLDVKTGKLLSETILDDRIPETDKPLQSRVQILNMPAALPDILSSDGKYVYMRSQKFDLSGKRMELGPVAGDFSVQGAAQAGEGRHLFAPFGFLDDSWFHRSYWVYGKNFSGGHSGYWQAGKFTPGGRILVVDQSSVYGYGRQNQYYKWTSPLEYHLFSVDKDMTIPSEKADHRKWPDWVKPTKKIDYQWTETIRIHVRAMLKADNKLFIAGPPDLLDEENAIHQLDDAEMQNQLKMQKDALQGKKGARLQVVSASDGKNLAEYSLDSVPVWDGLAATTGKLVLTTTDGQVICMTNDGI